MDAHLFRRYTDVLAPLLRGARLVKIQEPAEGVLTFNIDLFGSGSAGFGKKVQLVLKSGRKDSFLFLSPARTAAGTAPSAPVMRLRKYMAGHTIRAAVPCWSERELWLLLSGSMDKIQASQEQEMPQQTEACPQEEAPQTQATWLLLSLRDGAHVRFLDEDTIPEAQEPAWPEPEGLADALAEWRAWPVLTPALRRTLAGLDPIDARALCLDLEAGGGDLFLYRKPQGPIEKISCWPLSEKQAAGYEESIREDILAAVAEAGADLVLAEAGRRAAVRAAQPLVKREKKLEGILERQKEEEDRLRRMAAGKEAGRALQSWLWMWPSDMHASSVQPGGDDSGLAEVSLDPKLTVRENMERYFHQARRGERGLEHVAGRRRELEEELAQVRRQRAAILAGGPVPVKSRENRREDAGRLAVSLPAKVQMFISSDGFTLLRGRDAKGNEAVRRMASPHDIWVHCAGGPGSHVIIRRSHGAEEVPDRTLDEAGALAACRSWLRDAPKARLTYCQVRHVRPLRGAVPGTMRMDKVMCTREVRPDITLEEKLQPKNAAPSSGQD